MWIPVDTGMTRLKEGLLAYRLWNSWWLCDHFWVVFLLCSIYSDKSLILYRWFPLVTDGPRTLFHSFGRDLRGVPTQYPMDVWRRSWPFPTQVPIPPRKKQGFGLCSMSFKRFTGPRVTGRGRSGCDFGGSISERYYVLKSSICVVIIEFLPNSFFQQVFISAHYLSLWTMLLFWAPGTVVNMMCWEKLETQWGVGTERFCYWTTEQLDHLRKKCYFTLKCWKTLNVLYFTTQPL